MLLPLILSRMILAIVLAVVMKGVDGNQKIVQVSKLLNDGKEYNEDECCVYGNCSCGSLDHALANLTSNVLINITTDVTLSSLVTVLDLENVSIIGHSNPTVNCRSVGGIHFTFSCHLIIQGITWIGCGTDNINHTKPGLSLSNSFNVTIQNCIFQQLVGRAVALSEMSGDVNINDCKFVNNSHYRGHGGAIHYSSNITKNGSQVVQVVLTIKDCNFSNNKMKSLIYFESILFEYNKIVFSNCVFYNNQGTSIHAINHNISLNGKVLFQNNTAEDGAGIYISDNSTVTFGENSDVKFIQNFAKYKGGTIILRNHSSIVFDQNCIATFINNSATNGTVYSDAGSNVTFKGNCHVIFSSNLATQLGAAIYSDDSLVTFTGNSNVTFSRNSLLRTDIPEHEIYTLSNDHHSGIIYSINFNRISFEGSSTTVFHNNNADDGGGIYSSDNSHISFEGNSKTIFSNNSVAYEGGAIYHRRYGSVLFKGNATVEFRNNNAVYYGGAIESYRNVNISFGGYSVVTFTDNSANYGGSMDSFRNGRIFFEENSTALFNDNTADRGGAIYSVFYSSVSFDGNSSTTFNNNTADRGGAIYSYRNGNISFEGNSTTLFNDNIADHGGAIYSIKTSKISFSRNSIAIFRNNIADYGGAINSGDVSFNGNSITVFRDNIANDNGGAMRLIDAKLTFDDYSTINFTNNKATSGETIYSTGTSRIVEIGHPTVIFSDHTVNWCNTTCLSDTDHPFDGNVDITVDNNGTVSCNGEQQTFKSLSRKCGHIYLEDALVNLTSNELVNISDMVISSVVFLTRLYNISIIGNKVKCVNNAGLVVDQCSNITIEGINWVGCGADTTPVINILNSSDVTLQNCLFQQLIGSAVVMLRLSGDVNINHCKFMNNSYYGGHGAAIHYSSNMTSSQITLVICNCNFKHNDAISLVYINGKTEDKNISLCNSSFHNNIGISVYLSSNNTLHINGEVLFENNVAENGAGIYVNDFSKVIFDNNSNVKFTNNSVYRSGAAVSLNNYSSVLFDQNSVITFSSNSATKYGSAIYSCNNSHVTFMGDSIVNFNNNIYSQFTYFDGPGTVYAEHHSSVSFEGNSTVAFHSNIGYNGGAIVSRYNSNMIVEDDSTVLFNNNQAHKSGGAIFSNNGTIVIKGNSTVTFNSNTAQNGGAMYCEHLHSDTFSEEQPIITSSGNGSNETADGGAMYYSIFSIFEFANVTFINNTAHANGGAMNCKHNQIFLLGGNSMVTFSGNQAIDGGAVHAFSMCKIIFKENSSSTFSNNLAINNGGTIFSRVYSDISFMGTSKAIFNNNAAENGGIFYLDNSITLTFNDSAMLTCTDNNAKQNGGIFYSMSSFVLFNGNSSISLADNEAKLNGGVMYCDSYSNITFSEFTNVSFNDNKAIDGGVLFANNNSETTFEGHASVSFIKNEARSNGGAGYFNSHCSVTLKQNSNVTFENNDAILGGALYINSNSNITFTDNSISLLKSNKATKTGGAINIRENSNIMVKNNATLAFITNNAQYGGAMFFDATHTTLQFSNNEKDISFISSTASIAGDNIYFDSTRSSGSCFNNRIIGIKSETQYAIATPPNKLEFYDPAICIDNDNKTAECNTYYLKHIMLGEEINIPVCVLNYCNQVSYSIRFLLRGENNQNHSISGSNQVLLSCGMFQGISIIGNDSLSKSSNYTINVTLHDDHNHDDHNHDWKQVSVNLTVELTPCHPGFWQYPGSERCECYNANDIIFCSGSNSTIKRGYWFGSVTGKPTVTVCPINYCDFTCCEASNGYYHLSPVRDNQCRSHRSGTACGSCTDGYTLSFDSTECVDVNSCTAGQMILVILLTVTYWIVMVTLVFAMMYYKVGIGYLYSITYYYSIVDILLSENLYDSRGLYLTVSIMSSFSKITPQFLGELCLTTGLSGIDQYFIHFVHPSALLLILMIISLSARSSRRISAIISRGIIHVVCLLLLLSYTSIASTSLLLMRSLMFHDINKAYTYLSPDIEYFHGRHLAYGIVALICIVTIVVGLPLLLTLEPFLNHKFNFAKIKPLLDQFQGCYKDKYRCFAGYYMICRLLIITIVIAVTFNNMVANYLLITVCAIIALIQLLAKPYNNEILNKLDGVILQIMIFVTALPLFDDLDSPLVITIVAFILLFLPLLIIIAMTLYLHKDDLRKFAMRATLKNRSPRRKDICSKNEIPMDDYQFIRDSSTRESVTVTLLDIHDHDDIDDSAADSISYRESLYEFLNDIED